MSICIYESLLITVGGWRALFIASMVNLAVEQILPSWGASDWSGAPSDLLQSRYHRDLNRYLPF
jgi:hypothetical protein